jgi:hypothetical protein
MALLCATMARMFCGEPSIWKLRTSTTPLLMHSTTCAASAGYRVK